jgi:sugar/nucleoside kinase (ribokinase family)
MAGKSTQPHVGCAGILVSDTICGPLEALPKEGELLAVDTLPVTVGGCASNVACDLGRQGLHVEVVGCIGRDADGQVVIDALQRDGVHCDRIIYSDRLPTSQTIVLLVKGQDRRFIHLFGANAAFRVEDIDRDWIRSLDMFYVGGLFVLPGIDMDKLADLLKFCREHDTRTVVDVIAPRGAEKSTFDGLRLILPYADYFLPNDDEAAAITGSDDIGEQIATFRSWGADTVVITQGARGLTAGNADGVMHLPPFQVEAIDPTGGGDAFAAGFMTGLLWGYPLAEALRYGSALGASATLGLGTTTSVFTPDQAKAFLAGQA